MYAKLHFDGTNISSVAEVIVKLLTGTVDVYALDGIGLDPKKSYITTSKNVAGWTLDYVNENRTVFVVSAPCEGSAKRKYVRIQSESNYLLFRCGGGDPETVATTGELAHTSAVQYILNVSSSSYHSLSSNFEVRVSASARHFMITAGTQGYATGYGSTAQGTLGAVSYVFEHTCADSYFTEDTDYVPVVYGGSTGSATSSSNVSGVRTSNRADGSNNIGLSPRFRNLSSNHINDVTDANALVTLFTKFFAGGTLPQALPNNGKVWTSESQAVTALYPFGFSRPNHYFRGGSVTDLCDVYVAAPNSFSDFVEIRAGSSDKTHVMWNMGYGGYFYAVPKG